MNLKINIKKNHAKYDIFSNQSFPFQSEGFLKKRRKKGKNSHLNNRFLFVRGDAKSLVYNNDTQCSKGHIFLERKFPF